MTIINSFKAVLTSKKLEAAARRDDKDNLADLLGLAPDSIWFVCGLALWGLAFWLGSRNAAALFLVLVAASIAYHVSKHYKKPRARTQASDALPRLRLDSDKFWGDVIDNTNDGALFFGDSWEKPSGQVKFKDGSILEWRTEWKEVASDED